MSGGPFREGAGSPVRQGSYYGSALSRFPLCASELTLSPICRRRDVTLGRTARWPCIGGKPWDLASDSELCVFC